MSAKETFTLTVNGQRYERWEEIRVTREIDRICTDFNMAASERFPASASELPAGTVSGMHGLHRRRSGSDRLHRQLSAPG